MRRLLALLAHSGAARLAGAAGFGVVGGGVGVVGPGDPPARTQQPPQGPAIRDTGK